MALLKFELVNRTDVQVGAPVLCRFEVFLVWFVNMSVCFPTLVTSTITAFAKAALACAFPNFIMAAHVDGLETRLAGVSNMSQLNVVVFARTSLSHGAPWKRENRVAKPISSR